MSSQTKMRGAGKEGEREREREREKERERACVCWECLERSERKKKRQTDRQT